MADEFQLRYHRNNMLRGSRVGVFRRLTQGPLSKLFVVDAAGFDTSLADTTLTAALDLVDAPLPKARAADGLSTDDAAIVSAILDGAQMRKELVHKMVAHAISAHARYLTGDAEQGDPLDMEQLARETGYSAADLDIYAEGKLIDTPRGRLELRSLLRKPPTKEWIGDMVRGLVVELIAAEDPTSPLSDDAILEQLARRDIIVTPSPGEGHPIAKWRAALGIADAHARRKP